MAGSCLVPDCHDAALPDAPVALCAAHLDAAGSWRDAQDGVTDLLPSPCRACGSRLGIRWPSGWQCALCEWRVGDEADPDLPPPRIDVVYYLRFDDRVKIGTTFRPKQRFAALQHDELLALERGDRRREQERHALFAADRIGTGEWFRLSDPIREHLRVLGFGAVDPWDLWARWRSEAIALRG